ncbi:phosphoenolpyruvate--protein phosphotransferase [Vallitalea okinawensis]|uniref:phosphoenolpyruvate--protein phosphotransferase n=1 Tax=Vallitalea okinawensis TaxID=2078660 RepID=UPI000CFB2078|nr:phosphoenolpyruvate--protein phosphotransferase [Vallitalea okinawensis]
MRELCGINASAGYGMGPIFLYNRNEITITRKRDIIVEVEKEKLEKALLVSTQQVKELHSHTSQELGEEAAIFEAHILMLEDPDLKDSIVSKIEDGNNVEWAVDETAKEYIVLFQNMDSDYFKERALDIQDISKRVINNLLGVHTSDLSKLEKKVILVTDELTPSDTVSMDKDNIIGIVTETGGKTSHTAILARTLGIPAVTGVEKVTSLVSSNQQMIIDGENGKLIVNATDEQINEYTKLEDKYQAQLESLKHFVGHQTETLDGYKCKLYCNIGSFEDAQEVLKQDGEGVGLFRTEFLFMSKEYPPSEEEQYQVYAKVGQFLKDKEVIIRTLDVGGDKGIDYIQVGEELNPFLGNRAIRYCLKEEKILVTQLKAILRAAKGTGIKVMFPMITAYEEIIAAKALLERAKHELDQEEKSYNQEIAVGIMIETPAAVLNSDHLAKEVDFFSIGSNDLIQYTCAVDRMNVKVSNLYSPYNPAILKSIQIVVDNAHREGIDVGICGEVAADELLLPLWISLGIDELSVTPKDVLRIRKNVSLLKQDTSLIQQVLENRTMDEMVEFLMNKT